MFKKTLFALIVLVLLLASCGGSNMSAPDSIGFAADEYYYEDAESAAPMEPGVYETKATSYDFGDTNAEVSTERMVVKNADLAIIDENPAQTMDEISKMAQGMGGFVVESYLYQETLSGGLQVPHATITVRVPADKLDEALTQIKTTAIEVESVNVSGQDVTREYTDLASRLKNLEAAEAQLQAIMEEAIDTEDVLNIFNQLVAVRDEIEIIKGQMKYYEEAAALSKIAVSITADEAVQPIQVGGWHPSGVVKDALEALIKTLQFLVNVGIWFVLCILPIGLLIGLPLFFVARAIIRTRKRRKAESGTLEDLLQDEETPQP